MKRAWNQVMMAATAFLMLTGCNGASDRALDDVGHDSKGFLIREIANAGRTRSYGVFVPYVSPDAGGYPVIIFLHGMGEGGSDSRANLRVGLAPFVAAQEKSFKFLCIFPQSDNGQWDPDSRNASDVIAELDEVSRQYPVDKSRVSLTGLSTGGYGTWAIGAKYHDRFAALVPMGSSQSASEYAGQLVDMPVRSFHNLTDPFAGIWNDSMMVDEIKSHGGTQATFTQTYGLGHDCWDDVYRDGELFAWLENQRRPSAAAKRDVLPRSASAAPVIEAPAPTPVVVPPAADARPARGDDNYIVNTPF